MSMQAHQILQARPVFCMLVHLTPPRDDVLDGLFLLLRGSIMVLKRLVQLGLHITHDPLDRTPDFIKDPFMLSLLSWRIGR